MPWKILTLISLFTLAVGLNYIGQNLNNSNFALQDTITEVTEIQLASSEPPIENFLQAKAACVFDILGKKNLFEMNAGVRLPLASITKLMTALTAEENLLSGTLVEITKEAISQEGDSGLRLGETWNLSELIQIMLISSSNDAAFAIGSTIKNGLDIEANDFEFVKLMNEKARALGLKQSYFLNSTGLDISEKEAGAFGSCEDINTLMMYLIQTHPDLLEPTAKEKMEIGGRTFKNTNELLSQLPFFIGGKTGYSDLAGGNLTVATDKSFGHPIIITVLGSTEKGRFQDVEILYNKYVRKN